METSTGRFIDSIFESKTSLIARDLKLNLSRQFSGGSLTETEAWLVTLSLSTALGMTAFQNEAKRQLAQRDFSPDQISEAGEAPALMAMLNAYYKFRHMLATQNPTHAADYKNTGLRMNALNKPSLGKEKFEMLAFSLSVLNGCETCIAAHEKALREAGLAPEKIHDLSRLVAILRGVEQLKIQF